MYEIFSRLVSLLSTCKDANREMTWYVGPSGANVLTIEITLHDEDMPAIEQMKEFFS